MQHPRAVHPRSRRGLTLVETALAVPVLLLVFFGVFDLSRLLYSHLAIQHAVREGARFAVTGRHLPDPHDGSQSMSRVASIQATVVAGAQPFVTLLPDEVSITSAGVDGGGDPGSLVTVRVVHSVGLLTPLAEFFPNGELVIDVASVFKNEPFRTSNAP